MGTGNRLGSRSLFRASELALGSALAVSPILLGGGPTWSLVLVFALSSLASVLLLKATWNAPDSAGRLGTLAAIAAMVTGLRLVPTLFSSSDSAGSSIQSLADGHNPLHLAPGAGFDATLLLVTFGLVAINCHLLSRSVHGASRRLLYWMAGGGCVVLFVGWVQLILGIDLVLWVYQPKEAMRETPMASTLLNPNHLGGYLVLLTAIGLACADRAKTRQTALCGEILAFVAAVSAVLTFSHSTLAALVFLLVFIAPIRLRRSNLEPLMSMGPKPMIGAAVLGVILAILALVLSDQFLQSFLPHTTSVGDARAAKLELFNIAWSTALSHPWIGIGPGAFPDLAATVHTSGANTAYSHVENLPLQLLVDHGFVLGGAIIGYGLWLYTRCLRNAWRKPWLLYIMGGLGALILQNMADYNLSLIGTGVPATALFAIAAAKGRVSAPRLRTHRIFLPVLILLGALLFTPALQWNRDRVLERTEQLSLQSPVDATSVEPLLRYYPRTGDLWAILGLAKEQESDGDHLKIYDIARQRAPFHYFPAFTAARAYQKAGRVPDAVQAYLDSCHFDAGRAELRLPWVRSVPALPHALDVIQGIAAKNMECVEPMIHYAMDHRAYPVAYRITEAALRAEPSHPRMLYWHATSALALGQTYKAYVSQITAQLMGQHSERSEGFVLQGRLLQESNPTAAMHMFEAAVDRAPHWKEACQHWVEASLQSQDRQRFHRALAALQKSMSDPVKSNHMTNIFKARFALKEGKPDVAVDMFENSLNRVQNRPKLRILYLQALVESGKTPSTHSLCRLRTWDETFHAKVQALCDTKVD